MAGEWSVDSWGPIRLVTTLQNEREIDIDDREAILEVAVEMASDAPAALQAENVVVTIDLTQLAPSVSIRGATGAAFVLPVAAVPPVAPVPPPAGGAPPAPTNVLRPGERLSAQLTMQTGVFSSTAAPNLAVPSAVPGRYELPATVEFDLVAAKLPGKALIERDVTMQLVIAED